MKVNMVDALRGGVPVRLDNVKTFSFHSFYNHPRHTGNQATHVFSFSIAKFPNNWNMPARNDQSMA